MIAATLFVVVNTESDSHYERGEAIHDEALQASSHPLRWSPRRP